MTIYEGTIITCDSGNRVSRFLVEDQGRIVMVGEEDPVKTGLAGAAPARRILLGNGALVPAFGDTHIHFCSWSFFLSCIDVRGCSSNREIVTRLADFAQVSPSSKPLLAFGASAHAVREQQLVCRMDLDAAPQASNGVQVRWTRLHL